MILKKYFIKKIPYINFDILSQYIYKIKNKTLKIKSINLILYKCFSQKINFYEKNFLNITHSKLLNLTHILDLLRVKNLKFTTDNRLLNYYSIFHLQEYFSSIFFYNFVFRATNLMHLIKRYFKIIRYQLKVTKMHKKLKLIYPKDVYSLFFCSFMFKDVFLIQTWIKKQFERKSIKIYKSLIYTIWFLIKKFAWKFRKYNKLKSLFLSFKGKLVKGGSRKKLMLFNLGKLKSGSKTNKFISTSFVLRTISGSISCRLYYTF